MCCKNFWKKLAPFVLTFLLGLLAANLLTKENPARKETPANISPKNVKCPDKTIDSGGDGSGTGSPDKTESGKIPTSRGGTNQVSVLSKPRANYTDMARQNDTQGVVRVRVTFLASGEIGEVVPVSNLPCGLTEQAIAAAKQIKFEPATRDGVPISVTKIVEYTFTLY